MKTIFGPLSAGTFALFLGACGDTGPDPEGVASGGAAADAGPGYCETVPADPDEMNRWNSLCSPDRQ